MRPNEPKLFLFSLATGAVRRVPPLRWLVKVASGFLFEISPAVPLSLSASLSRRPFSHVLTTGIGLGLFFCLAVNAVWSVKVGTFSGSDQERLYFSSDWPNLINYTFLCPLYVGLSLVLITRVIHAWPDLVRPSFMGDVRPLGVPKRSIGVASGVVLFVSAIVTARYIEEILDPNIYPMIGWYVEKETAGGIRVLGTLGVYYSLLTFCLTVVVLAALVAFCSFSFLTIRIGRIVAAQEVSSPLTLGILKKNLAGFIESYLAAKLLAGTLVLNAYTWKLEKPEASANLVAMGLALILFGVIFVSVPRYYVELEWLKLKLRRALETGEDIQDLHSDDLRPFGTKLWSHFLDWLLFSGFAVSFFLYD